MKVPFRGFRGIIIDLMKMRNNTLTSAYAFISTGGKIVGLKQAFV